MKLTLFYDGQYWVGVAEESDGSKLKACREIFGAKPQDGEVMEFVLYRMLPMLEGTKALDGKPRPASQARQSEAAGLSGRARDENKGRIYVRAGSPKART